MGKVLVIDDSDAWFSALAEECERVGCSALRATDRDQALQVAADERPEMVVLDMLIAAKAGAGFIRQLRSLPALKHSALYLATTGTNPATARQALGGASTEIVGKDRSSLKTLTDKLRDLPLSA